MADETRRKAICACALVCVVERRFGAA